MRFRMLMTAFLAAISNSSIVVAVPEYSAHLVASGANVGGFAENVGDVNGDGYNDIALGNPNYSSATGRVVIVSGVDRSVIGTLTGDNPDDLFGSDVASLGDLGSDGRHEFVVAAPNRTSTCPFGSLGGPSGNYQGYVRAFSFNGTSFSTVYTIIGVVNGGFGQALAGLGDDNGDGKKDFIVTAPQDNRAADCGTITNGRAYVRSGTDGSVIRTHSSGNPAVSVWHDVANVGDIDNDGTSDYAIAESSSTYVYKGGTGSSITELFSVAFSLGGGGAQFRNPIAGLGDINGDGLGDIAVGQSKTGGDHTGTVKVFLGTTSGGVQTAVSTLTGNSTGDNFGRSIVNMGDLTGDSIADFGVLAGKAPDVTAHIRIFSGATRAQITKVLTGCPLGRVHVNPDTNIVSLGDVDGDSKQDFALGALVRSGADYNYALLSAATIGGESCGLIMIPMAVGTGTPVAIPIPF